MNLPTLCKELVLISKSLKVEDINKISMRSTTKIIARLNDRGELHGGKQIPYKLIGLLLQVRNLRTAFKAELISEYKHSLTEQDADKVSTPIYKALKTWLTTAYECKEDTCKLIFANCEQLLWEDLLLTCVKTSDAHDILQIILNCRPSLDDQSDDVSRMVLLGNRIHWIYKDLANDKAHTKDMTVAQVNEVFEHMRDWNRPKIMQALKDTKFCDIIQKH